MNLDDIFNPVKIERPLGEILGFFNYMKSELEAAMGCVIETTSENIETPESTHISHGMAIDIIAKIDPLAGIEYGGVICWSINYGKAVYIDVFFVAFENGKRIKPYDCYSLNYDKEKGWHDARWIGDEYGEWERYKDMSRWK